MIRLYLWFCRVLFCCTRTAGAVGTRLSLRPLIFRRRKFTINLAQTRGEIAELCSPSLRGARATKQSILSSAWLVWIASRALAMTRIGHAAYSGGRVGKGALAPCPPSIGSLILNGGHAFRPRSSSYGGRFCPPYALQMKATQSSNRAFPAAYGLPGGVLAPRFVRIKELQPLLGVLVAGRCGGAKRHRYWRRI
jgi:hypothetical protein